MDDLKAFLASEFAKINNEFSAINQRLDRIESEQQSFRQEVAERFDQLETELEDVKRVVSMSAQDIVDSQVEYVEKLDIQEKKMDLLAAQQNHLARRVSKLEKANEQ
ncbi:hypothetical protein [Laceyella putida]|uniref:Uncharacterized protein n=1 Tax=Laceyella putida TaxID=110101 RepID=A0ABW2RQI2_9BACL